MDRDAFAGTNGRCPFACGRPFPVTSSPHLTQQVQQLQTQTCSLGIRTLFCEQHEWEAERARRDIVAYPLYPSLDQLAHIIRKHIAELQDLLDTHKDTSDVCHNYVEVANGFPDVRLLANVSLGTDKPLFG